MSAFRPMTRIHGLSDVRRLPRVGKIRLGVKRKSQRGKDYPSEVSYFVLRTEDVSPEIAERFKAVYTNEETGELKPTELDIMFPVESEEVFFPQAYKKYAATGLVCKGDGRFFSRIDRDTGEILEGDCPGPEDCSFAQDDRGRTVCKRIGNLICLLPRVTWAGTWQIDTSSFHSIVDVNSAIDYIRTLAGRINMIPLKLRRVAKEIQYGGSKSTHYTLQLSFPDSSKEIQKLLNEAKKVRKVFEIFNPSLQIEGPGSKEIEEDLYETDLVREVKQIEAPGGGGTEPESAEPVGQQEHGGHGGSNGSQSSLPGMEGKPDDPMEDLSGADLLETEEERLKRTGEGMAKMVREQREEREAAKAAEKETVPGGNEIDALFDELA